MRSPAILCLLLATAGCLGVGADHERLGDEALARGDASSALAEYRAAAGNRGSAQLFAKIGNAARRAGKLRDAAQAYRDLVADDPSRLDEAATGLGLVAEAAEHANDAAGLSAAVDALRDVAPERLSARYALALVRLGTLDAQELVGVLPFALAAAPDGGVTDSLLLLYGDALRETNACEEASHAYEAAGRRSRDPKLDQVSRSGIATCGLTLGTQALGANDPFTAERWLTAAARADSTGTAGRRAWVGLGDLRKREGDLLGAAMAYQAVLNVSAADSVGRVAKTRLDSIAAAAPDSH